MKDFVRRFAVATPYPEASIFAIARTAWRQGLLSQLFTTISPSQRSVRTMRRLPIPPLRRSIERELSRRRSVEIPADLITNVSTRSRCPTVPWEASEPVDPG